MPIFPQSLLQTSLFIFVFWKCERPCLRIKIRQYLQDTEQPPRAVIELPLRPSTSSDELDSRHILYFYVCILRGILFSFCGSWSSRFCPRLPLLDHRGLLCPSLQSPTVYGFFVVFQKFDFQFCLNLIEIRPVLGGFSKITV
jgi:hypothetical protein